MGDLTAKSKDEKPTGKKRPREPGRTSTGSQIMGIHLQMILQRLLRMTCGLILCSISWFQILRLRMDWVMMTTREEHGMEMDDEEAEGEEDEEDVLDEDEEAEGAEEEGD